METVQGGVRAGRQPVALVAVCLAILLTVVVGIPRFAQAKDVDPQLVGLTDQPNGWFLSYDEELERDIDSFSFDIYEYHAYVEYFRGDFDRYPIYGPWRWRLVPSLIASWTPIQDQAVAFATVSLAFLVLGAVALVAASARNGLGRRGQSLVAILYAVSFPVVWYGTSGYVDGSSMALLCVGLYLMQSRRWWLLLLLLPIGMLTKETFLIIVPVAGTYLWARSERKNDWVPWTAAFAVTAVGTFVAARFLLPSPRNLDWYPRLARLSWNISRPEATGAFILSCGVVAPLALWRAWELLRARSTTEGAAALRENAHLIVGLLLGFLVALHGYLTAYADGRHIWTIYPWGVVLAAMLVERWITARRPEAAA